MLGKLVLLKPQQLGVEFYCGELQMDEEKV